MRRRSSWITLTTLCVVLIACGSGEDTATTTTFTTTTSPTTSATTVPVPTTTIAGASTTSSSALPGDPIDFGPAAGDTLAVVAVAHDDVLNLRSAPGANQEILAGIPPLYSDLIAVGETRQLPGSMWIAVDYDGDRGWVNLRYIAYLGDTSDATVAVVNNLGESPVAETMLDLGLIVAGSLASEEPASDLVLTVPPTTGDLGEVTYDVIGLGDDAVRGLRVHVFGQPVDEGFSLDAVEVTALCGRGVNEDGLCV